MSFVDEQVHFDTALKMHHGEIPHRGSKMDQEVVKEWACGVGHQVGPLQHGCNDPALNPADAIAGGYTTGYIHYPTYFAGAELFRISVEAIAGPRHPLSTYRVFSALLLSAGLIATAIVAYRLRLRGLALMAAVALPLAASETMLMGMIVNPSVATILFGALITGTGLHWLKTGRGFGWLLAVTAASACVAVVVSLPAGAVLLAGVIAWIGRRRGWRLDGGAAPTLKHLAALAAALVIPILAWGRYIEATSTATNEDLYSEFGVRSWPNLFGGLFAELTRLHSPWNETDHAVSGGTSWLAETMRNAAAGVPLWITVLVVGGLAVLSLRRTTPQGDDAEKVLDPTKLLAAAACLGIVIYPVALRLSNALTFGTDVSIAPRYSMGFAPMLAILALLLIQDRRYAGLLLGIGTVTTLALSISWM